MNEPSKTLDERQALFFAICSTLFLGSAVIPTLMAAHVLSYLFESGFNANLGWSVFGLFPAVQLLIVEVGMFFGMLRNARTKEHRVIVALAGFFLAFDAPLLFGFAMRASGC